MFGAGMNFPGPYDDDDDRFGGNGATAPNGAFTRHFRAYPVSFIDRADLERGDKIVLPPSALDTLARLNITYPMLFQLDARSGRKTHCGVQEFIAEEGLANIPYWLMQNLAVAEGEMITIRNASLPKGTYVKFQPQSSDFLQIANPKAVLEATLRNFTCLTKGDTIAIGYNDKTYYIDVLEVAPGEAISIVETDVNVDFAPAADAPREEEVAQKPAVPSAAKGWKAGETADFGDPAERLKKRLERFKTPGRRLGADDDSSDSSSDDEDSKKNAPPSFPGQGQTLKARRGGRGLTFGEAPGAGSSSTEASASAASSAKEKENTKDEAKKPFVAFSGKGRSLK